MREGASATGVEVELAVVEEEDEVPLDRCSQIKVRGHVFLIENEKEWSRLEALCLQSKSQMRIPLKVDYMFLCQDRRRHHSQVDQIFTAYERPGLRCWR